MRDDSVPFLLALINQQKNPAVNTVVPTVLVVTDLEGHPRTMIFYVI